MKTSKNGIEFIKKHEGLRLQAYADVGGVMTIGYGHVIKSKKKNITITKEIANDYLYDDIKTAEKSVNKYVDIYNFNQNQYDAMVDFAFNIGNIDSLTSNGTRSIAEIKNRMLDYINVKHKPVVGLANRRRDELQLFNQDVFDNKAKIVKVIAKSGLNLRTTPSMNGIVKTAVPYGTLLEIIDNVDGTWCKIKYHNVILYCSRRWVNEC